MQKTRWYHRFLPDYEVLLRLDAINDKLDLILKGQESMSVDLSKLQADVSAQTTVINSVTTLLTTLSGMIADLKNAGSSDPAIQKAIDDLALVVEQNSGTLGAAVQANTPVAPAPAPSTPAPVPTTAIPDGTTATVVPPASG